MPILLIGLNHKSAPVEVRERVSISTPQLVQFSERICSFSSYAGSAVLSTCNRTEFYCHALDMDQAKQDIIQLMEELSGIPARDIVPYLYLKEDRDAVQHLFSVSAGLDSMILGESQIQGQVQETYSNALHLQLSDSVINTLFMTALTVGKRVRTETQIDRQAVSISSAAVELATSFFGQLSGKTVLVLGAGETSELTSRHLVSNGISSIMVANRTLDRAQWLAAEIGGQAIALDDMTAYLDQADIIISSTASPVYVLRYADLKNQLAHREKPLLMIDIAVPRDIDPALNDLSAIRLFDIDDLQSLVTSNLAYREQEAVAARQIVEEELENFYFWLDSLWVIPTIVRMQDQVERIKAIEIKKAKNRIDNITPREEQIIEKLANGIVNRWLHKPMVNMKTLAGKRVDQIDCYIQAINDIWDLQDVFEEEGYEQRNL